MGESHTDRTPRLAGIEGLRAVAATSILVYHVYLYGAPDGRPVDMGPLSKGFDNLRAGVTLFFVLSGFLLYRVFVGAALRDRPLPSVRSYLGNRALRIVPAYWVILAGVVLVFHSDLITRPTQLAVDALFLQNYVPGHIVTGTEDNGIVPAWSVVIEVSFYLVLPILGYLAIKLARGRSSKTLAALVPVALLFAIGLATKALIPAWDDDSDKRFIAETSLPSHADWFAAGMAVAVARVLWEDGRLHLPRLWRHCGGRRGAGCRARRDEALLPGHDRRPRSADADGARVRAAARRSSCSRRRTASCSGRSASASSSSPGSSRTACSSSTTRSCAASATGA